MKFIQFKKQSVLVLNLSLTLLLLAACGDNTTAPATTTPPAQNPTTASVTTSAASTAAATIQPLATATALPITTAPISTAAGNLPVTIAPGTTAVIETPEETTGAAKPEETTAPAQTATEPATTEPAQTEEPTEGTTQAVTEEPTQGPAAPAGQEQEITFTSQGDTIHGSLLMPASAGEGKLPVALLISGSGPTDRDGNSTLIQGKVDTLKNFAGVLAANGVGSLRYDKLGTGKTGLAHLASHPADIDFQVYIDEARAAYDYLKAQPKFDPNRIMILGHSEGGLIGLVLADQLKSSQGVKALTLASPLSRPYLETIHDQLTAQYTAAVKAGAVTQAQADAALAELDQINKSLIDTGKYPPAITTPALKSIYTPGNEKFFGQVAKYDPQKIAEGLPASLPVLALCGSKDQQVSCDDVGYLMQGFQTAGNDKAILAVLANVDHVYKEVPGTPNPNTDYGNPNLKFSREAAAKVGDFVKSEL